MEEQFASKARVKTRGVPGYERGFWILVVASSLMVAMMFMMESSRARTMGFGLGKQVEIERLPAEEAQRMGVSSQKQTKKL